MAAYSHDGIPVVSAVQPGAQKRSGNFGGPAAKRLGGKRVRGVDRLGLALTDLGPVLYGPWCCSGAKGGCGAFGHPLDQCPGRGK
eukprot:gene30807-39820_t